MKKKVVLLLLFFSISLLSISARKRLLVWMSEDEDYRKVYQPIIQNYSRQNNIKIDIEYFPLLELRTTFLSSIEKGGGPDIMWCVNDWLGDFVDSNYMHPLDIDLKKAGISKEKFLTSAVDAVSVNDTMYAYPIAVDTLVMYYNKKFFKDGFTNTLEKILKFSEELHKSDSNLYGFGWDYLSSYFQVPVILSFGGRLFTDDLLLDFNSGGMKKSAEYTHNLIHNYKSIPGITNRDALMEMFLNERLATLITGTWEFNKLISAGALDKTEVVLLPVIEKTGKRMQPLTGAKGFVINDKSRFKEDALNLIISLGSDNVQKYFIEKTALISAIKGFSDNVTKDQKKFYEVFEKQIEAAYPMPNNTEIKFFWAAMTQTYKKIVRNEKLDISGLEIINDKMNDRIMKRR